MEIQTKIIIHASAEKIWQILTDFSNYNNWNPFIYNAKGTLELNKKLSIQLQQAKFSPIVKAVDKPYYFSWKGKLFFSGLFDGYHYFKIEPIAENTCVVIQGEKFNGILVPFLRNKLQTETKNGFEAMNNALKKVVESI